MAVWYCPEGTAYSVGAPRCPQCGSTVYTEEAPVAHITVGGGVSDATPPEQMEPHLRPDEPPAAPTPTPVPAVEAAAEPQHMGESAPAPVGADEPTHTISAPTPAPAPPEAQA